MKKFIAAVTILSTSILTHAMEHLPPELQKICKEKNKHDNYHCRNLINIFECAQLVKRNPRSLATAAVCEHRLVHFDSAWTLSYHTHNLTEKMPVENAIKVMEEAQKQYQNIGGYEKK